VSLDVTNHIVINRPIAIVSAFAADPSNAPRWYVNIASVEWKTPPPLAAGSLVAFVAQFMRKRMEYTYEFIDFVEGERLTMATAQGPFPMTTTYTWTAVSDGATKMTLRNHGAPAGFSKLLAPFMTMAVRRANKKDLATLKRLLESDG
jgi:Polyketide cyclase / dehydrase and lipid transport